jgi:arylformamidase
MKVYDISMTIASNMPVYKGKTAKRPVFTLDSDFRTGSVYETRLTMNLHTGTHLDAPLHIDPEGESLDGLTLRQVIGRCQVVDFPQVQAGITQKDLLEKNIMEDGFVLLKTRNSYEAILESDFVYLDQTGAEYLANKRVRGVGIDALGIERNQPGHPTHRLLLGAGIVILEGLRLSKVPEGHYLLVAAPVRMSGVEAAPVRALLFEHPVEAELEFVEIWEP